MIRRLLAWLRPTPEHPGWDTPEGRASLARIVRATTEERMTIGSDVTLGDYIPRHYSGECAPMNYGYEPRHLKTEETAGV